MRAISSTAGPAASGRCVPRTLRDPYPGAGRAAAAGRRLRGVPHRPAALRGRPAGPAAAGGARAPGRGPVVARRRRSRRLGASATGPGVTWLAGDRAAPAGSAPRAARTCASGDVHRLGPRRRLRASPSWCAPTFAVRLPDGLRGPRRRAAAVRRGHRLPVPAGAGSPAPRRRAWACSASAPRRAGDPGRPALGLHRVRLHPVARRAGAGPGAGRGLGRRRTTTRRPTPLDAAITFAPAGES